VTSNKTMLLITFLKITFELRRLNERKLREILSPSKTSAVAVTLTELNRLATKRCNLQNLYN